MQKGKGTFHALAAVVEISALAIAIQIQCEFIIFHHQDELVGRAIIQIERVRKPYIGGRVLESPKLCHFDSPGWQAGKTQERKQILLALLNIWLRPEDGTAGNQAGGLPGDV